jgi:hypothetical protein
MQQYHDLKFITALHVSAYSAIIGCAEIQGNCCAFRATTIGVFVFTVFLNEVNVLPSSFLICLCLQVCSVMLCDEDHIVVSSVVTPICTRVAINVSEYLHLQGWKQHFPSKLWYPPTQKVTIWASNCSLSNTAPLIRNICLYIHN